MRGSLLVLLVLFVQLFAAQAGSTAVKDFGANVNVSPAGAGRFTAMIQNTDIDSPLNAFIFVPGPNLKVTSVVRSDAGTCLMTGSTFTCNTLGLAQAVCFCNPGGIVNVVFTGSGSGDGSMIVPLGTPVAATTIPVTATPATTTTTTATTPSTAPNTTASSTGVAKVTSGTKILKPAAKTTRKKTVKKAKLAVCKKCQHSTAKKPCTKPK
jgi:hypothetical protein